MARSAKRKKRHEADAAAVRNGGWSPVRASKGSTIARVFSGLLSICAGLTDLGAMQGSCWPMQNYANGLRHGSE